MTRKQRRIARMIINLVVLVLYSIALCAIVATCVGNQNDNAPANDETPSKYIEIISVSTTCESTAIVERYSNIQMTSAERDELAAIIYLEARNQSAKGQQAVAEVVLNRVINSKYPNTVTDVLHEGENEAVRQFTTITYLDEAKPTKTQYDAIDAALYGPSILPHDVVFFSRKGENSRVWGKIEDHVFCYEYIWE